MNTFSKARFSSGARVRGFTLLEVMISLIIISIGLLGIAKIHALAYSSTTTASTRALVALQAAGLASSMHSNRTYWAFALQPPTINITGANLGTYTIDNSVLNTPVNCHFDPAAPGPACNANQMAAFALQTYGAALSAALPNSTPKTTITCEVVTPPVTCTIQVTWSEKQVAINAQGTANAASLPSYLLYVEP